MGLEDLTGNDKFIDDFNLSWPDGSADQVLTLDNHIFGIKRFAILIAGNNYLLIT